MNATDIIIFRVTGRNPNTRDERFINLRFNGVGAQLDKNTGDVLADVPGLEGLSGESQTAPTLPAEFATANASGDLAAMNDIMAAYNEQMKAFQELGGGTEELRVAKSCLKYAYDHEGFIPNDGDAFVLKLDNVDVSVDTMKDGNKLLQVAGTAIFGG